MEKKDLQPMSINSLHYFNAHTRTDEDVQRTFIVRKQVLKEILTGIANEEEYSIAQHYMVIGSRGMGKSTLLKMLEIELRTGDIRNQFIPVLFPEEQYNLDRLSKFWLNCLDALADTFEQEQNEQETKALDQLIKALEKVTDENTLADQAYDAVIAICKRYGRRPVLLVDNIDILFEGITKDQQFKLRKEITQNGAPIFVGASTRQPDDSTNYDAAFYDAFDNIYLDNLSIQELRELLIGLAIATGRQDSVQSIYTHNAQLGALHRLTGGNPRVTAFIFQLIANGMSDQIFDNLNLLLDLVTPLYKANFEQLAKQAQVIVDGLALHWDPCDLDTLSERTRISKDQLVSQLNRLLKNGWVERSSRFSVEKQEVTLKNKNYSIRERFFNIWYIMRRASRRQRGELRSLTCFLETFYTGDHLQLEKKRIMDAIITKPDADKVIYGLALARAHERNESMNEMEKNIYRKVIESEDGDMEKIATYLDPRDIPEELIHEHIIIKKNWLDHLNELESGKRYDEAVKFMEAVSKVFPDEPYVWYKIGEIHFDVKKVGLAEKAFQHAIALDKGNENYWVKFGEFKESLDDFAGARAAYETAISLNPHSDAWCYLVFMLYYVMNKTEDAKDVIVSGVQNDVQVPLFWQVAGNIFEDVEKIDEAEKAYRKAIALDPEDIRSLMAIARLLYTQKAYDNAKQTLDEILKINPQNSDAWIILGDILRNEDKYLDAEGCYKTAIRIDENSFYGWVGLSLTYAFQYNKFVQARESIEKAFLIKNSSAPLWNIYGWILMFYFPKDYRQAVHAFEKAIELGSNNSLPIHNLVYLLRDKIGDVKEAAEKFEKLLVPIPEIFEVTKDLHRATFAIYEENWGIAAEIWKRIFVTTNETISENVTDDWYKSIAATQKRGYGERLMVLWQQEGADQRFRPIYEALKALEYGGSDYLLNVAEEIREPALEIYEYMKRYQQTA